MPLAVAYAALIGYAHRTSRPKKPHYRMHVWDAPDYHARAPIRMWRVRGVTSLWSSPWKYDAGSAVRVAQIQAHLDLRTA